MRKSLATVTLLAAVVLAFAWVLGSQSQRFYQTALTRLQEKGMRVLDSRYRRGWFRSDASVRIELPPSVGRALDIGAISLRIESRIVHGPWDLEALRLPPSVALIENRVELPLAGSASLPLLLNTRVELDGSAETEIQIPSISRHIENSAMETEEGLGELKFSRGAANVEGRLDFPFVSLSIPDGFRIELRDLRAQADGSRWIRALYTGEGAMSLGRAELRASDASLLALGLSVTGKTVADGGLWNLELASQVEKLTLNDMAYGPSQVSLSLRRLPGDVLASLQQAMQRLSGSPRDPSLTVVAAAAILAEHLPLLLADDPRLTLDPVVITTTEGIIRGRLSLASQELTRNALERSDAWLGHLVGEGELSLPRPLLLRLLEGWERDQLLERLQRHGQSTAPPPETLDDEIVVSARQRLALLVRQGWLVEEAGGLAARAKLADAFLTVNGKTLPVGTAALP